MIEISRHVATIVLVGAVYQETGPITAIAFALIAAGLEMVVAAVRQLKTGDRHGSN